MLVFNRNFDNDCSRATELLLDPEHMAVETGWQVATDDCLHVYHLGDSHRLPNGNTMILCTSASRAQEVTPDQETVWEVNLANDGEIRLGHVVDSLY